MKKILVTGAGGFIGHHLTKRLVDEGHWVRGVDIKYPEYEPSDASEFEILDLRKMENCLVATIGIEEVYNLAADMGGIGYTGTQFAQITKNNILINSQMLESSRLNGIKKFLFSSTACVYPQYKQSVPDVAPLKESDVYPAEPDPGYGLEKLFTEELCNYYNNDHGLDTRIVRFHNVFGPLGTYDGGKEKAPAAVCRKIGLANSGDTVEVWGDGKQTRSFMFIDDCVEGLIRIMDSDYDKPLNLGSDRLVTINELYDIVANIASKKINKKHDLSKPQGVRGRNSDNTLLREILSWEPQTTLEHGLTKTYKWIHGELKENRNII